ncbi:MAG TPA: carbon-nitrogen hydrolase family protein [Flexivirga sp.]|uniref:carbon-nitrogen hydrolase family protein n=1 Tax=Flexivirga sp. TaxID=1962927 RepID=UPI002C21D224|nr:carbon-nitrogen hydrolase family protein [Flexivirga sp.]HWC24045.1 carbon-nitrogen hydrolase family protein [Flexivirga sp.]
MKVSAAQMSSTADPVLNLQDIEKNVRNAADSGARLVVFPEASMCPFGTDLASVAEPLDGPFATALRELAAQHRVTVIAGMFTPADAGRVHNTLLITGAGVDASYNKIHLYDAFGSRESDTVAPGQDLVTFEIERMTIGVATCYDLRFADQFRALGRADVDLVVVPASWGEGPGKAAQWQLLVQARALDSQAWILACDQAWNPPSGSDPLGIGNSMLVDPFGCVRAQLGHQPALLSGEVDPSLARQARARIPLGEHAASF